VAIDYRIVPRGFIPDPVVSVGVCYTAVDAAAGGLTTGWWAVVLECFSSHPLVFSCITTSKTFIIRSLCSILIAYTHTAQLPQTAGEMALWVAALINGAEEP